MRRRHGVRGHASITSWRHATSRPLPWGLAAPLDRLSTTPTHLYMGHGDMGLGDGGSITSWDMAPLHHGDMGHRVQGDMARPTRHGGWGWVGTSRLGYMGINIRIWGQCWVGVLGTWKRSSRTIGHAAWLIDNNCARGILRRAPHL